MSDNINPTPTRAISVGDVVQLKSGGPPMTVGWVDGPSVRCNWFDGGQVARCDFSVGVLRKVQT